MNRRTLVDLLLLGAIWGSSFLFMRLAAPEFGPVPLIAVRVGVAALFLSAVLAHRDGFGAMRGQATSLGVLGAINSAIPFSLFAFATLSLPAGFAAVINATAPLFGALVAYLWFREALPPARVAGLILGFAGVTILVSKKLSLDADRWAVAAGLLAGLLYGIAAHYTKRRLGSTPPLAIAAGSQIAAALLLSAPAVYFWPVRNPSLSAWFFAGILGIVCTGLAYVLFFRLIARAGASKAIAVAYLIPVFGMTWGWLFLGESVSVTTLVGGAVILLGTAMATGVITLSAPKPVEQGPAAVPCKS